MYPFLLGALLLWRKNLKVISDCCWNFCTICSNSSFKIKVSCSLAKKLYEISSLLSLQENYSKFYCRIKLRLSPLLRKNTYPFNLCTQIILFFPLISTKYGNTVF